MCVCEIAWRQSIIPFIASTLYTAADASVMNTLGDIADLTPITNTVNGDNNNNNNSDVDGVAWTRMDQFREDLIKALAGIVTQEPATTATREAPTNSVRAMKTRKNMKTRPPLVLSTSSSSSSSSSYSRASKRRRRIVSDTTLQCDTEATLAIDESQEKLRQHHNITGSY